MGSNLANSFETELGVACTHLQWEYFKIPVPKFRNMRWGKKPPYDIITNSWVSSFAIEAKSSARLESFPFCRVEPHQVEGLLYHAARGWPAYVAINFRPSKGRNRNIAFAINDSGFPCNPEDYRPQEHTSGLVFTGGRDTVNRDPTEACRRQVDMGYAGPGGTFSKHQEDNMSAIHYRLRPLSNYVLAELVVEQDKVSQGGIIIPDVAKDKPTLAVIVAVGPGWLDMLSGNIIPVAVNPGDSVIIQKHGAVPIEDPSGRKYAILAEGDILAVVEEIEEDVEEDTAETQLELAA